MNHRDLDHDRAVIPVTEPRVLVAPYYTAVRRCAAARQNDANSAGAHMRRLRLDSVFWGKEACTGNESIRYAES